MDNRMATAKQHRVKALFIILFSCLFLFSSMAYAQSLSVDKPAPANADNDFSGTVTLNDVLTYTITATNTGATILTNVVVSDSLITSTGGTTPCTTLEPAATCTLIGIYTVNQKDVNAGQITNTGTADSTEVGPVADGEITQVAQIRIGPIGYHWMVYDRGPLNGAGAPDSDGDGIADANYISPLPDTVQIGARVCNLSDSADVSNLSVTFSWDPNGECAAYPTTSGDYTNYYKPAPYDPSALPDALGGEFSDLKYGDINSLDDYNYYWGYSPYGPYTDPNPFDTPTLVDGPGLGSYLYCRADRLWLESMESTSIQKGYDTAFAYTETKNLGILPFDSTEPIYWDRYDEMQEMATYDTRAIEPLPAHCKDVYFNVSGDLKELADLDDSGNPGGSVPFQITASGDGIAAMKLTAIYSGSPNLDYDDEPRNDPFGAAVASYEVHPDPNIPAAQAQYPLTGPPSVLQGNDYTYTFGWGLGALSVMFSTFDFPDDLFDIIHAKTEVWTNRGFFNSNDPPNYVANRNGIDPINIDDNWYHNNLHMSGTWWGWYAFGIGDPDGRRVDAWPEPCYWPALINGWPLADTTAGHVCNFKREGSSADIRQCYGQESDCNLGSGHFYLTTYTVRAKRDLAPADLLKWSMSYTEGAESYVYWYLVDEITYANVEDFRAYEGRRGTIVEWTTSSEDGTAGYDLYRQKSYSDEFKKINRKILPAMPGSSGGVYSFVDRKAFGGGTYTYKLVEIEADGDENPHGPYTVTVQPAAGQGVLSARQATRQNSDTGEKDPEYSHKKRKLTEKSKKLNRKARESHKLAKDKKKKRRNKTVAKLMVDTPGLYHLKNAELAEMLGVSRARIKKLTRGNKLSLVNKGETIPLLTFKNGAGGAYFYGTGESGNYSDENVYWLKKSRKHKEKRRLIKKTRLKAKPGKRFLSTDVSFPAEVHAEDNNYAYTAFFDNPEDDYWMWDFQAAGYPDFETRQYPVDIAAPASGGAASLLVNLKGISMKPVNGQHHARISLNGNYIGDVYFKNQESTVGEIAFDPSLLNDGVNTVEVHAVLDGGTTYSIFCVNSFDIQYERLYQARDDKLFFKGGDNRNVVITGFSTSDVFVLDITDPTSPRSIRAKASPDKNGGFLVAIPAIKDGRSYFAVARAGLATLADKYTEVPSLLRRNGKSIDYLVIAPTELLDGAKRLADYRASLGMRTLVVDLEDVMDEFNFGIYSPEAIRDLMEYAYKNWKKSPDYLVLIGNGTYDYKNLLGYGDNLMPVRLVDIDSGLYSSDTYYVDVEGNDAVPELAVGRIPVRTAAELDSYITKLVAMESTSAHPARSKMLLLADSPGVSADFSADSDGIAAFMPDGFEVEKIYLADMKLSAARTRTIDAINEGVGFVNFVGHSGVTQLGQDGLLGVADVAAFTNVPFSPIMTLWTCVAGKFELPGYRGIADALLMDEEGGASAIFAASGLVDSTDSQRLGKFFYDNVRSMEYPTLGDVVLRSKQQYGSTSTTGLALLSYYNILGDPAMPLR